MWRCVLGAGALFLALTANAAAQEGQTAQATMTDREGNPVGQVVLTQMAEAVLLQIALEELPPGWHAIHIHETARCEPPFASAGDHFNPDASQHGLDPGGPHAGDLPNFFVGANGQASLEFFSDRIALSDGQPTGVSIVNRVVGAVRSAAGVRAYNVLGEDGTSIIVHARADDYRTRPAGDAGERIACGVIERR